MIVRGGTGIGRAFKHYVLGNWPLVLTVLVVSRAIPWVAEYTDVLQTDVFSATAIGLLATVVGIFIVFRFNEAYQRWWEARILSGGLVNESRTFSREVNTLLSTERTPEIGSGEVIEALQRELVYRHLAYCNALRLSLRGQDDWDQLAPSLSATELNELKSYANKPTQLNRTQGERLARSLGVDEASATRHDEIRRGSRSAIRHPGRLRTNQEHRVSDKVRFISRALVWLGAIAVPVAFRHRP